VISGKKQTGRELVKDGLGTTSDRYKNDAILLKKDDVKEYDWRDQIVGKVRSV
jgi:hypothetical protein